jgi:hypothetical protein
MRKVARRSNHLLFDYAEREYLRRRPKIADFSRIPHAGRRLSAMRRTIFMPEAAGAFFSYSLPLFFLSLTPL